MLYVGYVILNWKCARISFCHLVSLCLAGVGEGGSAKAASVKSIGRAWYIWSILTQFNLNQVGLCACYNQSMRLVISIQHI